MPSPHPSIAAPEAPPAALPSGLARFRIVRELGRGTAGVVHEALDTMLGHAVALKTVPVPLAMSRADQRAFIDRVMAEARTVARLSHPNIVHVHDFGLDVPTGTLFVALELLPGRPLSEAVSESSPLLWPEALRIVERAADALHHAHLAGVIHRDVKPANLMLLPDGAPKLLDFGIAKIADAPGHWSLSGQVVGTPLFMSPEQAIGEPVDARSDVFALGAVLYFLLTGRAPFAAATVPHILMRVLHEEPVAASRLVPDLPEEVEYVVARAMAKHPRLRYQSAVAMGQDVADVLAGRRPRHRRGWLPPGATDTLPPGTALTAEAALADLEARLGEPVDVPASALISLGSSVGLRAEVDGAAERVPHALRRSAGFALVTAAALALTTRPTGDIAGWAAPPTARALALAADPVPVAPALTATATLARPAAPPAPAPAKRRTARAIVAPAAAVVPSSTLRPVLPAPVLAAPARLTVEVEHSLRRGRARLWVDDALRLERGLGGPGQNSTLGEVVEVEPGTHRVRLELAWDDNVRVGATTAAFRPDERRRLTARLGGLLKKRVTLQWRDARAAVGE
jgi:tRNA A-37 threonylcarbamoyl transferase component Bud32